MEKGSGTPLSKVSDRVRAWEFYQHEPEAVPATATPQIPKQVIPPKPATTTTATAGLKPSSIDEYRLLFQSPSPTPDEPPPFLPTLPGTAGMGSINEFCRKFEDIERTTTNITSTSSGVPGGVGGGEKPKIPEKPKRIPRPTSFPESKFTQDVPEFGGG